MQKKSKRKISTKSKDERLQHAHLEIARILDESELSFVEMMGVLELSKIGVQRALEAREQEAIDNSLDVVETAFPPHKEEPFDRADLRYIG